MFNISTVSILDTNIRLITCCLEEIAKAYSGDIDSTNDIRDLIDNAGVCFTHLESGLKQIQDHHSNFAKTLFHHLSGGSTIFLFKEALEDMSRVQQRAIMSHELGHLFTVPGENDGEFEKEKQADMFSVERYGVKTMLDALKILNHNYEKMCEFMGIKPFGDAVSELVMYNRVRHLAKLQKYA